ncbi:hypothetical protein AA0120_g8513 [Alternaria tenuissima]|nr:hypothetical protein AA0120_g8513 [Alternaria tenuissima]
MQFSTTALAIISAFIASSTAADTLSFTISTCSACINLFTSSDCSESETPEVHQKVGVCDEFSPKNSYMITC